MNGETRQQIAALLHAGHSDLDIHHRTGAARTTIARHRKQLGLPGYRMNADSPACRHGHPWPANRGRNDKGHLVCIACKRAHWRETAARNYTPAEPDHAAIQRAVDGHPPGRLTPRERRAAIRQLDARDYSAAAIAEHVRCSPRTVHRARSQQAA